jgi:hypothetical protein
MTRAKRIRDRVRQGKLHVTDAREIAERSARARHWERGQWEHFLEWLRLWRPL